jgi:hypothetical protein
MCSPAGFPRAGGHESKNKKASLRGPGSALRKRLRPERGATFDNAQVAQSSSKGEVAARARALKRLQHSHRRGNRCINGCMAVREGLMRRSLWVVARLVMVLAALAASAPRAEAITLTEIIELTRAGLSEEVLLALIDVDQRVFAIDPDTLKTLKDAGVSPRVIVAIVKSGRTPQPQPDPIVDVLPPDPPDPQVLVVERPVVYEVPVAVPVPVYVAVGGRSRTRHRDQPYVVPPPPFVPFGTTVAQAPEPRKRAEPVYWGWGGKLRPDAWQPDPTTHKR